MKTYTVTLAYYTCWSTASFQLVGDTPADAAAKAIALAGDNPDAFDERGFDAGETFVASMQEGRPGSGWPSGGAGLPLPLDLIGPEDQAGLLVPMVPDLIQVLAGMAGLLETALEVHIYDTANGEVIPPDDPHVLAARAALALSAKLQALVDGTELPAAEGQPI